MFGIRMFSLSEYILFSLGIIVPLLLGIPKKIGHILQACFLSFLLILVIVFYICSFFASGLWGGLGYLILMIQTAICLIPALISTSITLIIRKKRIKREIKNKCSQSIYNIE